VGEASGPQGVLSSLELRWALSSQWLISPFYDHGRVSKRSDDNLRSYSLQGAGVSATWTGPEGWVGKTTYAYRIQDNPNPTDSGKDQDGSLRKGRFWFALSRSF
jgi:hemolysin activation/secretion protein